VMTKSRIFNYRLSVINIKNDPTERVTSQIIKKK
jgi:hypothetical protein